MKTNQFAIRHGLLVVNLFTIVICLMAAVKNTSAQQWTGPDGNGNISNSNSGNVGIGTTSIYSTAKLQVRTGSDQNFAILPFSAFSSGVELDAYNDAINANVPMEFHASAFDFTTGNVGIGTAAPSDLLQIDAPAGWALRLRYPGDGQYLRLSANQVSSFTSAGVGRDLYLNTAGGNVGIGTTTPAALLHVYKGTDPSINVQTGGGNYAYIQLTTPNSGNGYLIKNTATANSVLDKSLYLWNSNGSIQLIPAGDPTKAFTLDGSGNVNIAGNINAKYQDVAEWVPSSERLTAGTVVALDPTKANQVVASTSAYDTRVAGVISEQPGITLGEKTNDKVLVATTGRVRVKVDASKAPIQIGDLLVTSDIPGVAMKSEAVNLGGVQIHRPGTLIGKALEPLVKGQSEILVLLSLQ